MLNSVKDNVMCAADNPFLVLNTPLESPLISTSSVTCVGAALPEPLPASLAAHPLPHTVGLFLGSSLAAALVLTRLRVLLSGDIELNPGPGPGNSDKNTEHETEMTAALSDSFKRLEDSLQKKLDTIISQISRQSDLLRQQEDTMKRQAELLKQQGDVLRKFGEEQEQIKETVTVLCSEVKAVKGSVSTNESVIGELSTKQDQLRETVENLETEIDRLEGFSRRNNVKFFGIPEASVGGREDCAEAVTHLLQTYIPNGTWGPETIERAHRLGRFTPNRSNPRPIIAKFQSWRDAIRVMKDRQARNDMENDGVRAAQDLTRRQVDSLKRVRAEGKVGYFVNGQLRIRDHGNEDNGGDRRGDRGRGGRRGSSRGTGGRGSSHHMPQRTRNGASGDSYDLAVSNLSDVTAAKGAKGDNSVAGDLFPVFMNRPCTRSTVLSRQATVIGTDANKNDTPSTSTHTDIDANKDSATNKQ